MECFIDEHILILNYFPSKRRAEVWIEKEFVDSYGMTDSEFAKSIHRFNGYKCTNCNAKMLVTINRKK